MPPRATPSGSLESPARVVPLSRRGWRLAALGLAVLGAQLPAAEPAVRPPNDNFAQPESTKRMVARLREIYDKADPLRSPFRSGDQVPLLRKMEREAMAQPQADPSRVADIKFRLALHLLQSGMTDDALRQYQALERYLKEKNLAADERWDLLVRTGKAMSHLRAGERANCLLNHNGESCIFPIQGGGIHQLPEGSRAAIVELNALLERHPLDLRARWLLNIAHMTLGEYPAKVPARWLIPPERFKAEDDIGRFPDVAAHVGLAASGLAGGVVMEDFDRDGFLDVMVSTQGFEEGKDQTRVFRSNGDGTFEERTDQAGLTGLVSGLNLIHGDYNNDGYADVLILRGGWMRAEGKYPFSLLRNNGDFTFTDVTEEAGLLHFKPTQTAVWFDYNGDGWLDIFVGNESMEGDVNPCELYRNNGDGTFTECAAQHGVNAVSYVKGVAVGDYNNDGRTDLYLSGIGGPRILFRWDPLESTCRHASLSIL